MFPSTIIALALAVAAGGFGQEKPARDPAPAKNLIVNPGFEAPGTGWNDFWSRTPGGSVALDADQHHGGTHAARIEHTGSKDWSLQQRQALHVRPGEIYELSGWLRLKGEGTATVCGVLRDERGRVLDWSFGGRPTAAADTWRRLTARFVIPPGGATLLPRLIGQGPATVWADDLSLVLVGSVDALRSKDLPPRVEASSKTLQVSFDSAKATLGIVDRRNGRTWSQIAAGTMTVLDAKAVEGGLDLRILEPADMLTLEVEVRLEPEAPEVVVTLKASGPMYRRLSFPAPFATSPGEFLIMPVNEGISYPVDDASLPPMAYYLYGGHGLCMGFWGVTNLEQGLLAIVETPDDARVDLRRVDGLLCQAPQWEPQKRAFGPARRIRYCVFDSGGYVALAKRYRRYAKQTGLLKTFVQKRRENPNVDKLIGAVNVWCWDRRGPEMCGELQSLGIRRILWSDRAQPEEIRKMNAMGVLTSRYDIYQDCMNPANFDKLSGVHPDWTSEGWPDDLMLGPHGDWIRGWRVRAKDGQMIPCGVLCDRRAPDYARRRIPAELKTHPYQCRFIDTTTASPWRECYHPHHPMTRSDSRRWKMKLLDVVSRECGLICGSETGHEAAVPYVHYFEGMLSLGPYRVPDAGRRMLQPWDEVPERVAKFQTGHYYRLPLWELVYHDCVVAQWYWGDYNNKLPSLWDRRDLFNALYGTPPMFMFNRKIWKENRDRFVQSYRTATPVARATGYVEMLSHRWLTADHAVQETTFANGVAVTVNFGQKPYRLADGTTLGPLEHRVKGLNDQKED